MNRKRWVGRGGLATAALAVLLAASAFGCGNSYTSNASGSLEEAKVKGIVRVRGKAVTNGRISFRGSNVNRPGVALKEAEIGKDGSYSVQPVIGQNFVEVTCKELFTPQNRALVENERMVEVKSGEQTIHIDIPEVTPTKAE